MPPESRLVIVQAGGERKQYTADKVVDITKERLASMPLLVTDGLKFYTKALLKHYSKLATFPPTGKSGHPPKPKRGTYSWTEIHSNHKTQKEGAYHGNSQDVSMNGQPPRLVSGLSWHAPNGSDLHCQLRILELLVNIDVFGIPDKRVNRAPLKVCNPDL